MKNEYSAADSFEPQWGWLRNGQPDALDDFSFKAKQAAKQNVVIKNYPVKEKLPPVQNDVPFGEDALDRFVQMAHSKVNPPIPRNIYSKPILSSQEIGWRPNLERFGRLTLKMR